MKRERKKIESLIELIVKAENKQVAYDKAVSDYNGCFFVSPSVGLMFDVINLIDKELCEEISYYLYEGGMVELVDGREFYVKAPEIERFIEYLDACGYLVPEENKEGKTETNSDEG